jgi:glycerol kinase
MSEPRYILALDQGTSSCRAFVFNQGGEVAAFAQREFPQIYPAPGLVEHDAEQIWQTQIAVAREALARARVAPQQVAAIGITNQRETTVVWERESGRPVANAIVWQSRVSAPICERLKEQGVEPLFRERTGLLLDPYFSGTKLKHLLDSVSGLRERACRGEVLFGTIDTFLVWRLTGAKCHVTDPSNASRTLMFNIATGNWDAELLKILDVPAAMLPQVQSSSEVYGETDEAIFGARIPIAGIAGDQQAALFGQLCVTSGMAKATYGTGAFVLLNTGGKRTISQRGLLTSVAWKRSGETTYCAEGAVFVAGAVVQWLRDQLKFVGSAAEIETLARSVPNSGGVFFVPAFVGLGAPHWDPYARGTIVGITRDTTPAHIARAALDAIALQTADVLQLMQEEAGLALRDLRVDGGAARNDYLMQLQADLLDVRVVRPKNIETTALGAAYLAGLAVGFWNNTDELARQWSVDREFVPRMPVQERDAMRSRWREAVRRSLGWAKQQG